MPLSITINGTDRTSSCRFESLRIHNTITSNADFADLAVFVKDASWRPQAANPVVIQTSSDSVIHFAGSIEEIEEEQVLLNSMRYRVSLKDYTLLFDRRMVTQNYLVTGPTTDLKASTIISHIVSNYCSTDFSSTGVQTAPAVAEQRFDYVYPSDAIRGMADQLQWLFWIDYNKVVQFVAAGSLPAPLTSIDFDASSSGSNWSNAKFSESAANVKNRVILQGFKTKASAAMQSVFQGDGFTKFNLLGYEPAGISTGDMVADINGVPLTLYTDTIDGTPSTATVAGSSSKLYICYDNMGARMDYTPSSTEILTVTFYPLHDDGFQYDDAAAQTNMAAREGGDGVHMYQAQDPGLTNLSGSADLAVATATALTTRYGSPKIKGTFDSFTQGWRAGQAFSGTSAVRMSGFTKQFYVHAVTKTLVNHPGSTGTPLWKHNVEFGESPLPL